jgi:AraC-like DNA-binding protein
MRRRKALHEWLRLPLRDKRKDLETYLELSVPALQQAQSPQIPLTPASFSVREAPAATISSPPSCVAALTASLPSPEYGWHFSCANAPGPMCGEITSRHCPSRVSYFHYLPFAPQWMGRPARKLYTWSLTAVLGAIRAEQCASPDGRVSLEAVRAAVHLILQTRGGMQLCLKTVARQVYLSESYLAALFSRAVGICFRNYVRSVRFACAAELLIHSGARISEISATLGYTEFSNFVRDMRSATGICPTSFRRLCSHESFIWTCPLNVNKNVERNLDSRSAHKPEGLHPQLRGQLY